METVTVELKYSGTMKLLKELERMDIIKITGHSTSKQQVTPSQLRGFLSKDKANALLSHISASRNECEERFPSK